MCWHVPGDMVLSLHKLCLHLVHLAPHAYMILQVLKKIAAHTKVNHPNIVSILGVSQYPGTKDLLLVSTSLCGEACQCTQNLHVLCG